MYKVLKLFLIKYVMPFRIKIELKIKNNFPTYFELKKLITNIYIHTFFDGLSILVPYFDIKLLYFGSEYPLLNIILCYRCA